MRRPARRRQRRDRRHRPFDAERLAAARQHLPGGVDLVLPVRIARPLRTPGIIHRAGDLQRVLDLGVIMPHHFGLDRPIDRIPELRARLEPLRTAAQRHHLKMHGAAADALSAVVRAELDRVVAAGDPRPKPEQLLLRFLVGGEILERAPERAGVEPDHRKPVLGQLAGQGPAARPGPDNREIDLVLVAPAAHRQPPAAMQRVGGAPVLRPRPIDQGAIAHFLLLSSMASHGSRRFACMRT